MERRRYLPPSLAPGESQLENRQLLASSLFGSLFGNTTGKVDEPPTIPLKRQRVNNLPLIMVSYQRDRALPPSVITPIQDDLRALLSLIHNPGQRVLLQFNREIRAVDQTKHFSARQAADFLHDFDIMLNASGTDTALRHKFTADMTKLAQLDAGGPEPTFQLTNDFAIIAQLTQSVGQPMPAPKAPALLKAENLTPKKPFALTIYHRPTFVGTATPDLEIVIALTNGGIIATGKVNFNGQYTVKSEWPLPDGIYKVKAYTFNDGYNSLQSGPLTLVVRTPPAIAAKFPGPVDSFAVPRGPLG
jgi:hypothetical protein